MTNQSIWQPAAPPTGAGAIGSQGTNAQTLGTLFYSSSAGNVTQIWYYSAPPSVTSAAGLTAVNALPAAVALYTSTGTLLYSNTSPAWSGAPGSGWVSTNITSTAIAAGTTYIAAVEGDAVSGSSNYWNTYSFGYFGTGNPGQNGIANGVLTAPGPGSAVNPSAQGYIHNSAGDGTAGTLQFPGGNYANACWWVDVTVSTGGTPSVTGSGGLAGKKAAAAGTGSATGGPVTGSGALAGKKAAASGSGGNIPVNIGFPYHPLSVKVELLLGATWTDITAYVQLRNPVSISPFGRTNETSGMQAAEAVFTLNNRSGRFTPGNSLGAYYPFIQLNTQVRVSVSATSVNGTAYSGYRFWGEVSSWPPVWDESGRDAYVSVTASGIWRRLSQSGKKLGSPYTRYNTINIPAAWSLASYCPMEDGSSSAPPSSLANLVPSQAAMAVSSGAPTLSSCTAFPGSDAIPALNGAVLTGIISTSAHPANVLWRFNLFVPSGGDSGASGVIARMTTAGTVARVEVSLSASGGGPLTVTGYSSGGAQLFTGSSTLSVWGIPLMVQVGLAQSGGNVTWSLRTMLPGATTANTTVTGSVTGTVSDSTGTSFNLSHSYKGTAVGQSVVVYGSPVITDAAAALAGWPGEYAGARFLRVCGEQGIAAVLTGSSSSGTQMGPQPDDTLANVLQQVEDTDGGQLFETRTQFGLGYRTLATMQNQVPAVTLDYSAQQLFAPLAPVVDDALVRNDWTLTNYDGYAVRVYLNSGARSVQPPPNGVGSGYEAVRSVSAASHAQVAALGQQLLNSGTVSDPRYPTVTVNLARVTTAPLFNAVPSLGVGDYLQLVNLPAYGGAATQKQLAWGWTETIGAKTWTFTFNTIPEAPFESGYAPGATVTGQVPGSPVTLSQSGSVSGGAIAESAVTLFSLAQEVLTYQFGGITSNINSVAPSSPSDGDLWFDSSNGYQLKRWDATGGSWVPVVFSGANILGAGTVTAGLLGAAAVVAGNIAAGAVTASQLAAGIVKAGIVDGTLISGAQFVAYGTTGEILVYSGTPTTGNLLLSVSAMAGTDGFGNAYKGPGVWLYDSGGNSVGLVPGGGSASSQIALSTGNGTPTPPAGSAALYGAGSGGVQAVDGADGQAYTVQRRSIVPAGDQPVTSTGFGSWASSPVAAPASTARIYRVHGVAFVSPNQAAGKAGFQWTAPAGVSGHIDFAYLVNGASVANSGALNQSVSSGANAPAFTFNGSNPVEQTVVIDGAFQVPAGVSGTFALQAACGVTGDSFIVRAFSFLDVMPV